MVFNPPKSVLHIFKVLKENGYEAYAVGGCVRDSVLGREPEDWDIASDALPADIKRIFPETIDTGLKHGTVTVLVNGKPHEVTTFRIDGPYNDGRHPASVEFTGRLEEDLSRRDFTINAMAWNRERGLIDPFGGFGDIAGRCICTVGDPDERFREDALRMLRAVRFAARLGFEIDPAALKSIARNRGLIKNVSSERIRDELNGIITAGDPMKFMLLRETGLLKLVLPEVDLCFDTRQDNPHHIYNVGEHSLRAAAAVENDTCLRWAMLLHDTGKAVTRTTDENGIDHFCGHPEKSVEIAEAILTRLKFDNKSKNKIIRLVKYHDRQILPHHKAVAKAVRIIGDDIFLDLVKVKKADKLAQSEDDRQKGLEYAEQLEKIFIELQKENRCVKLKDLAIDGHDLISLGYKEGREIGNALEYLLDRVLDEPALNNRDSLSRLAEDWLKKLRQEN